MFATTLLGFTFSVIWAYIILIIWIAIAFWPARVAGRKGHSFIGYFIFSLFFFPLALLVAYLVPDRGDAQPSKPTEE
ncbi:MAG TPA: hypothetical protein VLF79_01745 [Candidatus Saccharimonadales bacterium]|nr:hypothetical protein [Candidatus Saccharimonadales bacterium]